MKVMKFGGSSVRDAAAIERVCAIVAATEAAAASDPPIVVVSALGGVTDVLLETLERAEQRDEGWHDAVAGIDARHRAVAEALATPDERSTLGTWLDATTRDLEDLLHGVFLLREASARTRDAVAGFGERTSSMLIAAALRAAGVPAEMTDARTLIVTDDRFGAARVDRDATDARLRAAFAGGQSASAAGGTVHVLPGFVAATADGHPTTLGRGGSDFTAALVGAALAAEVIELWTDVDAVMTADPALVGDARPIRRLRYVELLELCHFGARVVYPPAVHPSRQAGVPLAIRNTFRPQAPGTRVGPDGADLGDGTDDGQPDGASIGTGAPPGPVRGISSIPRVALLRLEGDGMVGMPGIAGRLFSALAGDDVNVILISQASSEHSICFAVAPDAVAAAVRAIDTAFALERRLGLIDAVVVEDRLSVVAAVGAGMREQPGIAGTLFVALGRAGINVRAIAQGSSELNISLVVAEDDRASAVRALHDAFLATDERAARIAVAGVGGVGSAFLGQLAAMAERQDGALPPRLVAVGTRGGWLVDLGGIEPRAAVARARAEARPDTTLEHAVDVCDVFVDLTASDAVAAGYDAVLASGAALVAANKRRFAGPQADYDRLLAGTGEHIHHEATVGAGLPVVGTLRDLVRTGDRVLRIEGTLSGTLAFVAAEVNAGEPLSRALRTAFERGWTEPDPREDLAGLDVARKLVILSRVVGHAVELAAVRIESLVPRSLAEVPLDTFWQRLGDLDASVAERAAAATANGGALAFLAATDADGPRLALETVPADHPCAASLGTDNVIIITTERYRRQPLVVRGPGAGREVTAAGVLADVLRATRERPAADPADRWRPTRRQPRGDPR